MKPVLKYLLLNLVFILSFNTASAKELVDKIAASISSDVLLLSEVKNFTARIDRPGSIDETLLLGMPVETLKSSRTEQLNYLLREKILDSEIRRLGMTASESQVDGEMTQMAKRNHLGASEFSEYLKNQGYTLDEYRKVLKTRIERQGFYEREIVSKLRITDEDALSYFQAKNPKYQPTVGEFKIAQIFFSAKKGGLEGALNRAKAAREKLDTGEKFETLANQLDETPGANQDGFLGSFKSGEFLPELEKSIVALNENQVSGILRGPSGFHIIKLLSKKNVMDPEFLRVKENIKAGLIQQNFDRQLKNWFELKKLDANLKIYENAAE
jgi:peptidyl-prolyl cis-trans isomerase SurA